MALILKLLGDADGRTVSSEDLRKAIPEYRGPVGSAGQRRFERDKEELRDRGLIESDLSVPGARRRKGVRLRRVDKPSSWELTVREHAAVRRARQRSAGPIPSVSDGGSSRGAGLGTALDALRVLEEHGGVMSGAELAAELHIRVESVVRALRELHTANVGIDYLFDTVLILDLFEDSDVDEPPERQPANVTAMVKRTGDSTRPLHGAGLSALGRFAYSAGETRDRLAAIDTAREERHPDDDLDALESARAKLVSWLKRLDPTTIDQDFASCPKS